MDVVDLRILRDEAEIKKELGFSARIAVIVEMTDGKELTVALTRSSDHGDIRAMLSMLQKNIENYIYESRMVKKSSEKGL